MQQLPTTYLSQGNSNNGLLGGVLGNIGNAVSNFFSPTAYAATTDYSDPGVAAGQFQAQDTNQAVSNAGYNTGATFPTSQVPTSAPPPTPPPSGGSSTNNQQQSSGGGNSNQDLINALMAKGYNQTDATNAANGPSAGSLRNEYLGGSNGPSSDFLNQVNNAYSGLMGTLENWKNSLPGLQAEQLKARQSDFDAATQKVQGQVDLANSQIQQQQQGVGSSYQQAYDQMVQNYNQSAQGTLGRYGGSQSNSVGSTIQGLLLNSLQGNLGQLLMQKVGTDAGFAQQFASVTNSANDAVNQFTSAFNQAKADLDSKFTDEINSINAQEGMAQTQKTNTQLGLLQNMLASSQQLSSQLQSGLVNIGTTMAYALSRNSGIAFTPQDLQSMVSSFTGIAKNLVTGSTLSGVSNGGATAGAPAQMGIVGNIFANQQDQLGQLANANGNGIGK